MTLEIDTKIKFLPLLIAQDIDNKISCWQFSITCPAIMIQQHGGHNMYIYICHCMHMVYELCDPENIEIDMKIKFLALLIVVIWNITNLRNHFAITWYGKLIKHHEGHNIC